MSETVNIGVIAEKISWDIFRVFHWEKHKLTNENFQCVHNHHLTDGGDKKNTHPADVVFHYHDPYLNKRIYLHTDLKSYKKGTLRREALKKTLQSLAWTTECANLSENWRKFCVDPDEGYEVRGLLFVANHDRKALDEFESYYTKINRQAVPIAAGQMIYVLGPSQITNLYSIAMDIKLLKEGGKLPALYHFYYPDLTLWKRQISSEYRAAATIESLLSPYFIVKHGEIKETEGSPYLMAGSVVYYSRKGETVEEFVYLLDSLSRAQLVDGRTKIRVRVVNQEFSEDLRSNFEHAKAKYCRLWRFGDERSSEVNDIEIDVVQCSTHNYSPEKIGWEDR